MLIQVIEAKTKDPDALHRRLELWDRELRPFAIGYLGSTAGCTRDGDCILIARFENRDAARRNSERPEQMAWWTETEKCFDGPVSFHDTEDVHVIGLRDPDNAHFIQVMEGHVTDRDRAVEIEYDAEPMLVGHRPELLGVVTAFFADDHFTETAYFSTEAEARAGEQNEMPADAAAAMTARSDVMQIDRYFDIADPWLTSNHYPVQ